MPLPGEPERAHGLSASRMADVAIPIGTTVRRAVPAPAARPCGAARSRSRSASCRSWSVLILPLPTWLLDISLALSITFSVLILMVALFIDRPLEFSSFPTVLLITTMLRLALNLASTRLILSHGNEGTAAAGHVIQAFGNFVMSGNFVIGVIVFTILVVVNFVVITKGSGRIAEVAARFSLDSMPGKQMAIDADLSAGLIDEGKARQRRARSRGRKQFLRRHGRRLEIRARRRHRRPHHHLHQHHRRHRHRRGAEGHDLRRRDPDLHAADRRRRPGDADPGADRLDRGRHAGVQGGHRAARPTRRCSASWAPIPRRSASPRS